MFPLPEVADDESRAKQIYAKAQYQAYHFHEQLHVKWISRGTVPGTLGLWGSFMPDEKRKSWRTNRVHQKRIGQNLLKFSDVNHSVQRYPVSAHSCGDKKEVEKDCMYKYTPLEPRNMRVLHLSPGKGDDPVSVRFTSWPLGETPPYEALSYTWGDPTQRHIISCESGSMAIGCNLWAALSQLRFETEERVLWVDALCINQQDMPERESQVALMRDIYEGRPVVVWLGEASPTTSIAFNLINNIADAFVRPDLIEIQRQYQNKTTDEYLQELGLPPMSDAAWSALDELFWRPWYFRMWIIQELVLAKDTTVHCGPHSAPWDYLDRTARFVHPFSSEQTQKSNLWKSADILPMPFARLNSIRYQLQHNQLTAIKDLLMLTNNSQATMPVDKIYALLGLSKNPEVLAIKPDYHLVPEELFTRLAKNFIQTSSSLDTLSYVSGPFMRNLTSLPSWVPDWSTAFRAQPLLEMPHLRSMANACGSFTSSSPSSLSINFSPDDRSFSTPTVFLDKISLVGRAYFNQARPPPMAARSLGMAMIGNDEKTQYGHHFHRWELLAEQLFVDEKKKGGKKKPKYPSVYPDGPLDAFARTLIADAPIKDILRNWGVITGDGSTNEIDLGKIFADFRADYGERSDIYHYQLRLKNQQHRKDDAKPASEKDEEARAGEGGLSQQQQQKSIALRAERIYDSLVGDVAWGRTFFITEGGYMGLGPYATLPGDDICIFKDGRTPFVVSSKISSTSAEEEEAEEYVEGDEVEGEGGKVAEVKKEKDNEKRKSKWSLGGLGLGLGKKKKGKEGDAEAESSGSVLGKEKDNAETEIEKKVEVRGEEKEVKENHSDREGKEFQLIGETYIYGLMNGEGAAMGKEEVEIWLV